MGFDDLFPRAKALSEKLNGEKSKIPREQMSKNIIAEFNQLKSSWKRLGEYIDTIENTYVNREDWKSMKMYFDWYYTTQLSNVCLHLSNLNHMLKEMEGER